MFEPSQLPLFREPEASSGASPARTFLGPAKAPGSLAPAPDSGSSCATSSPLDGRNSSSSKTSRAARNDGCARCGPICKLSATERAPSRFLPPTSGLPIFESASSSSGWPTPGAADAKGARRHKRLNPTLVGAVTGPWATPAARDWKSGKASETTMARNSRPLNEQVLWPPPTVCGDYNRKGASSTSETLARWASPRAKDADAGADTPSPNREGSESLRTQAGAKLNPEWVECLMGFPSGWTDIGGPLPAAPSNTRGSRRARSKGSSRTG